MNATASTASHAGAVDFRALHQQYRDALLNDVLPFWSRHSIDEKYGGYLTSLNRDGSVYDTDKFLWLQGREAWMFAKLYKELEPRPEWLRIAKIGIDFLRAHGQDESGNWYFALTRDGTPLVQPYNIFSDCFAVMAFSAYARATDDKEAANIALTTYRNVLRRKENSKGKYSKIVPGTRPAQAFALPMILLNLSLELEWLLPPPESAAMADACISEIMGKFLDRKRGLIYEQVAPDGLHIDSFDGRLLIPGHGIEGMWFVMDVARRKGDRTLIDLAIETTLRTLDFAWDEKYGGIYYFMDAEGKPPDKLEWDQKLWWVHNETLITLALGYLLTGDGKCLDWLMKVHDYTWAHFPDPEYGEWYGYLNRRGEVLLPLKGGKWKGCFHVPRMLYRCAQLFDELASQAKKR